MGATEQRTGSERRRSGPVRRALAAAKRDRRASGPIEPVEAVRWAVAAEYARLAEEAPPREAMAAAARLEELLVELAGGAPVAAPSPSSPGEGVTPNDDGDSDAGGASLYALPPAVGDSSHP